MTPWRLLAESWKSGDGGYSALGTDSAGDDKVGLAIDTQKRIASGGFRRLFCRFGFHWYILLVPRIDRLASPVTPSVTALLSIGIGFTVDAWSSRAMHKIRQKPLLPLLGKVSQPSPSLIVAQIWGCILH